MADSYLNKTGLSYFWDKIKAALGLKVNQSDFDALKRINRTLVPETEIADNKDLNTTEFLSIGKYYISDNAHAATLINSPTSGKAFTMEVLSPIQTTIDNETTGTRVYRLRIITTYEGKQWTQKVHSENTAGSFIYSGWQYITNSEDVNNQIYDNTNSKFGNVRITNFDESAGRWVKIASMSHHARSNDNVNYTFQLDFGGSGATQYRQSYIFGVGARMSNTALTSVAYEWLDSEKFHYSGAPNLGNLVKVTRKWVAGTSSTDHYIYFEIWVNLNSGWKTYWLHPTISGYKNDYSLANAFRRNSDEWTYETVYGTSAQIGKTTYLTDGYEEVSMVDARKGASYLDNFYTARPTTADTAPTGRGGLFTFKATTSMSGKPAAGDGHIIQMDWDNTGGYDSQIYVSNASGRLYTRGQTKGTWGDWKEFIRHGDSATFNDIAVTSSYPQIKGNGALYLSSDTSWGEGNRGTLILRDGTCQPSSSQSGTMDLGASNAYWRNLYLNGDIIKNDNKLTLPSKEGTVAITSDIPTAMVGATDSSDGSSGIVPVPSAGDNIKYLSGDGTWSIPSSTYSSFLSNSPGTLGYWKKLGNLTFSKHEQGQSVFLKILIGFGNNGNNNQQAFIDLVGQLGWTGSYSGRAGWTAIFNEMNTNRTLSDFVIKVIANSVLNYDVYIYVSTTYTSVTPIYVHGRDSNGKENVIWTPDYSAWTKTAPTGTECNIAVKTTALIDDIPTTYSGSSITDGSITFDKTASGEFLKLETSTTDPGEGTPLASNTLLAVYDVIDDYRRGEVLVSTQNVDTLATTSNVAAVWSTGTWTQFGRMASSSNKHILTIENPTSNNWIVEISLDCPSVLPGSVINGSSIISTTPATGIAELDSNNAISKVITWTRITNRSSVYNRKYVTIPANTTKKFCACVCTYQTASNPTGTWEGGDEISGTAVGAGFGGPSCTLTAVLIDNGE